MSQCLRLTVSIRRYRFVPWSYRLPQSTMETAATQLRLTAGAKARESASTSPPHHRICVVTGVSGEEQAQHCQAGNPRPSPTLLTHDTNTAGVGYKIQDHALRTVLGSFEPWRGPLAPTSSDKLQHGNASMCMTLGGTGPSTAGHIVHISVIDDTGHANAYLV